MPQTGFNPPFADDASYEADTIPTKPPWLDCLELICVTILRAENLQQNYGYVGGLPSHVG